MSTQTSSIEDETIISALFITIGILPSCGGFGYLKNAVMLYKGLGGNMSEVCAEVARRNDVTPCSVERNMRSALNTAQDRGTLDRLNEVLGVSYVSEGFRVCSKEFVSIIAEYMSDEYFRNTVLRGNLRNINGKRDPS